MMMMMMMVSSRAGQLLESPVVMGEWQRAQAHDTAESA